VIAGLALAVAAAACFETGYVLQALEARASRPSARPHLALLARLARRPAWLAGIGLAGAGVALQALALLLAPLSVVQPALALGLVMLLGLARRVLGERVGRRELAGAALIAVGVATVALCAPGRRTDDGAPLAIAVVMGALGVAAIAPYALRRPGAALAVAGAGAGDVWAAVGLKLATNALSRGALGAALGWAVGCAAAAALALAAEMSALQRVAAARVGPIVLAAQVALPVLLAPLVSRETWGATPGGGLVLGGGLAAVAAGAAVLGASRPVGGVIFAGAREPIEHDVGGAGQRRE
jgi:drug/metabolite transporter (DMT)-like permease